MIKIFAFISTLLITLNFIGQTVTNFDSIQPSEDYENIHVQKLDSDSLSTTFAIWVKLKVRMHKHAFHTENVYVSEGEGTFYLGDEQFPIKKGDLIVIPKNTWHGVDVTSTTAMKVISLQSPEFKGNDRIFKE